MIRPTIFAALLTATIGCAAGSDATAESNSPTVRDSAGVEIVEYSLAMIEALPLMQPSDSFELSIGAVDGDEHYVFSSIVAAALLSDGKVAIVDRADLEVRYYSAKGEFLGSVGRKGDGPGELRHGDAWSIFPADTLRVWEMRTNRLLTITGVAEPVREIRVAPDRGGGNYLGTYRDGSHLLWTSRLYGTSVLRSVDHAIKVIEGSDGAWVLDTIVTLSTAEKEANDKESAWEWEPTNGFAFHPHGVWTWEGMVPQVSLVDHNGRLVRIVRWEQPDPTVRPEDERSYIETRVARAPADTRQALRASLEKELVFPDSFPALAGVATSANGTGLIVQASRTGGVPVRAMWSISPEGRLTSRIRGWLPRPPLQLDLDRILTIDEGVDGVPMVRVRRLGVVREPS